MPWVPRKCSIQFLWEEAACLVMNGQLPFTQALDTFAEKVSGYRTVASVISEEEIINKERLKSQLGLRECSPVTSISPLAEAV